jgi:hypothetical protein
LYMGGAVVSRGGALESAADLAFVKGRRGDHDGVPFTSRCARIRAAHSAGLESSGA